MARKRKPKPVPRGGHPERRQFANEYGVIFDRRRHVRRAKGSQFKPFPRLPDELQLMVWQYALPTEGRVIKILTVPDDVPKRRQGEKKNRPIATWFIPAMLHACHLSRLVAFTVYSPQFINILAHPVYFNFEKEILFFDTDKAIKDFQITSIHKNLVAATLQDDGLLVCNILVRNDRKFDKTKDFLTRFENLSHLMIETKRSTNGDRVIEGFKRYWDEIQRRKLWEEFSKFLVTKVHTDYTRQPAPQTKAVLGEDISGMISQSF